MFSSKASAALRHTKDRFGGISIEPESVHAEVFQSQLDEALLEWTASDSGIAAVWLKVTKDKTAAIPMAIDAGFELHHAQEANLDNNHGPAYVMLTRWMLPGPSLLPRYASHYIGIGGFVKNRRDEVLVVAEKFGLDQETRYKLPGGLLHAGESLADGVEREVFEETGVKVTFANLVSLRHNLQYPGGFGCADIYHVCNCHPTDEDDIAISIDEDEIASCRWMPVKEFLADQLVYPFNKVIAELALQEDSFHFVRDDLVPRKLPTGPGTAAVNYYKRGAQLYHGGPHRQVDTPQTPQP
jgi:8-oxo-dGTP pyrophosphatase MutT (NUDIX family)